RLAVPQRAPPDSSRQATSVTQVVTSVPVPAYSESQVQQLAVEVERVYAKQLPAGKGIGEVRRAWAEALSKLKPACMVPPGELFFEPRAGASHAPSFDFVPCGTERAWILASASNREAVVWRHKDGKWRVTQVTKVECDSPTLTTWIVDDKKRR